MPPAVHEPIENGGVNPDTVIDRLLDQMQGHNLSQSYAEAMTRATGDKYYDRFEQHERDYNLLNTQPQYNPMVPESLTNSRPGDIRVSVTTKDILVFTDKNSWVKIEEENEINKMVSELEAMVVKLKEPERKAKELRKSYNPNIEEDFKSDMI